MTVDKTVIFYYIIIMGKKEKEPVQQDSTTYIEVWDAEKHPHRYKIDKNGEFTVRGGSTAEPKQGE